MLGLTRRGGALRTTPWRRRTPNGVYFGHSGNVCAYFELPLSPQKWEDAPVRVHSGDVLATMLTELGDTTADLGGGMNTFALKRGIHIFSASYDRYAKLPDSTPEHVDFLSQVLPEIEPSKTLLVGVKLWPKLMRNLVRGGGGNLVTQAKAMVSRNVDAEDSFDAFVDDYEEIFDIVRRAGGQIPSAGALNQLESWFNLGNGPDAQVQVTATNLRVTGAADWEISALTKFVTPVLPTPSSQWLLDAMTHPDPAVVVSVRAELTPNTVIQAQLRTSQRKLRAAEEEEARTGDISRDELAETASFAKELENTVRTAQHAWLADCSVLMAREYAEFATRNDSFLDMLRTGYGIEAKPLEHRQLQALDEMQPCSTTTANPFVQVVNPATIAYAGLTAFSHIGDPDGMWMGRVDPDYSSVFIDPFAAPNNDKPPVFAIFGDPGSGKAGTLDSRVLTPSGWTTMGRITVGEEVVGRDGRTYRVTGVYPQGVMPIYRVTFDDGSSTEVTGSHLWAVTDHGRRATDPAWQVLTTDQLRERGLADADGPRWRIPMVVPVERPAARLPVDPYLLGALLGAGGPDRGPVQARTRGNATLTETLTGLGLSADEVFVPEPYKWASIAQRRALLRGLLDAAGAPAGPGRVHYLTSNLRLARDVVELVQSLGGTGRLEDAAPGPDLEPGIRVAHRVTLTLPADLGTPFRVAAKLRGWTPAATAPTRHIAEIVYVRDDEAQCISVSAPDRLYVTDDYIVTHNTFVAQLLALQAALSGVQTIFINPKGFDSLAALPEYVREYGVPAERISMQDMEQEGGAFDPFRFVEPLMAAEILLRHITTVIGTHAKGITMQQEILLGDQLKQGAENGARCAGEALEYVTDPHVKELILSLVRSSTLFALGFSMTPKPAFDEFGRGGLTLIEFDRDISLPPAGKPVNDYEREERIAVGAMRLITRAAMEILMRSQGGMLIVDEAHHYLGSPEGLNSLQRMGREGRSLNLLPVFLTQRVSDLLGADMENYLSRVLVMKLTDEVQAKAALTLCGLRPAQDRVKFLRDAGPRKGSKDAPGRGSLGFFRDIEDRHSVVMIGPVPEDVRLALSTNPEDKRLRAALRAQAEGQPPMEGTP